MCSSYLGVEDGEQIEHKMLSNAIEKAQKKIEANNFGIRKNLLEYDQVMNEQREIIYAERRRVLNGESMRDTIYSMITEYVENMTDRFASTEVDPEEWDIKGFEINLHGVIPQMELPSEEEMQEGRANLAAHDNQVDFIVTHCCATSTQMLIDEQKLKPDIETDYLDEIKQTIQFKKWFFGHYHDNRNVSKKEILIYEQFVRIG